MDRRIGRRGFIGGAAALTAMAALEPWHTIPAFARGGRALPNPSSAPFNHVIVLMMENRSFDHFLGWLPAADGFQSGLTYRDTSNPSKLYPTYQLAPDYQGCGYADPDHSWEGGATQLNGGKMDGFLKTAAPDDTFPIGYYTEESVPVLGALARNYTVSDYYFCSILAETFPNRFYMHAATTDRDHNMGVTQTTLSPTIWDRVAAAGLTGKYYGSDTPFIGLWGTKYASITSTVAQFLVDCQNDTLPNVAFVDPPFQDEGTGTSRDDHPHADIRAGEWFMSQIYEAVRNSPAWPSTVMVLNYDEWGGFFDHVVPPKVTDTTTRPPNTGPHPDYRQLGFRVPNVVISPFSQNGAIVHDDCRGPFEHTSILKMIEWRWGLTALTDRDKNARNLAELLDFSLQPAPKPSVPTIALPPAPVACGVGSVAAHKPAPLSVASGSNPTGRGCKPGPGGSGPGASSLIGAGNGLPNTAPASPSGASVAGSLASGGVGIGLALAAARRRHRDAATADKYLAPNNAQEPKLGSTPN